LNPINQTLIVKDLQGYILVSEKVYKTGGWKPYKFAKDLPHKVIIEIEDKGIGTHEWSAVAFKE
jgi:hypothetical protein